MSKDILIAWLIAWFVFWTPVSVRAAGWMSVIGGATTYGSPVAMPSWLSTTNAVWLMESAGDTNVTNSGGGGTCTITDQGNVARNSTAPPEGSQSAGKYSDTNYHYMTDANCATLDFTSGASFTMGAWFYADTSPSGLDYLVQRPGREMSSNGSSNTVRCDLASYSLNSSTTWSDDTWVHGACVLSDTGNYTVTAYAKASGNTSASQSGGLSASNDAWSVGRASVTTYSFDGYIDEIFIDSGAWSAAQIARACSVTLAGSLGKCDSTDQTKYLPCNNNTDCGDSAVCDTGATATDDTYCVEGGRAGCCMGRNSTSCSGSAMTACNATGP